MGWFRVKSETSVSLGVLGNIWLVTRVVVLVGSLRITVSDVMYIGSKLDEVKGGCYEDGCMT